MDAGFQLKNSVTESAESYVLSLSTHNDTALYDRSQLADAMTSEYNIGRLTNLIVARADPTRSLVSNVQLEDITTRVTKLLLSWRNLGKFERAFLTVNNIEREVNTATMMEMINFYNNEFISSFAESLVPTADNTNVKSVVNPGGMFAQQERIEMHRSKPIHFHERSIFKRLNEWSTERPLDETQALFYGMDKKANTSDAINSKQTTETYLDRETLQYRMNPNY